MTARPLEVRAAQGAKTAATRARNLAEGITSRGSRHLTADHKSKLSVATSHRNVQNLVKTVKVYLWQPTSTEKWTMQVGNETDEGGQTMTVRCKENLANVVLHS